MRRFIGGSLFTLSLCLALLVITLPSTAVDLEFETVSGFITNVPARTQVGDSWFDGAGNLHRRGWFFGFDIISSDERFDGATAVDELNGNWFANRLFDANMWGNLWIYQQDGGVWEGTWVGKVVGGQQFVSAVAKGMGGTIDGKKLKMTLVQQPGSSPSVFDFTGEIH